MNQDGFLSTLVLLCQRKTIVRGLIRLSTTCVVALFDFHSTSRKHKSHNLRVIVPVEFIGRKIDEAERCL